MKKYVSIFLGDVRHKNMPVFQYNKETDEFQYDGEDKLTFSYPSECILVDKDWVLFSVDGEDISKENKSEFNKLFNHIVDENEIDSH